MPVAPDIGGGWKETDWDKLLINIEAGTVIPIIGRDLLYVSPDGKEQPVLLYNYIATRLLEELGKDVPQISKEPLADHTLNDAVGICMRHGRNHFDICYSILEVLKQVSDWPAPVPLQQLAEITDFQLFVSTTFDPLMERALEASSAGGEARHASVYAYDPKPPSGKAVEDLPLAKRNINQPVLYHLMGRLTVNSSNVVISDEDLLEFVCALYSENKKRVPVNLLNEFSKNHLLLLGCSFSDWLARFFLRAAKRRRLSTKPDDERLRNIVEYVVDDYSPQEKNLVLFLEQFWTSTRIFRSGNVVGFVNELRRRWGERNPQKIADATKAPKKVEVGTLAHDNAGWRSLYQLRARRSGGGGTFTRELKRVSGLVRSSQARSRRWLGTQNRGQHCALPFLYADHLAHDLTDASKVFSAANGTKPPIALARCMTISASLFQSRSMKPKRQPRASRNLFSARIGGSSPMARRRLSFEKKFARFLNRKIQTVANRRRDFF